jgi:hypothetical protein
VNTDERERDRILRAAMKDIAFGGGGRTFSGFEGSQAVPGCPFG